MKRPKTPTPTALVLGALLAAVAPYATAQFPSPLLYYNFEGDDAAMLVDKSGNGRDGDVNGDVELGGGAPKGSTPGKGGQFSINDGSGGFVSVPEFDWFELVHADGDRAGDYTLSCWLKADARSLGGDRFIWGQTSEGVHNGLRNGGKLHTAHWGSDFDATTVMNEGEWVHAAWTYDGANAEANIYLNGVLDGGPFAQNPPNGSGILIIGGRNGGTENFIGCLDDLAIWPQILSVEQIEELAAGDSPIGAVLGDSDTDDLPDDYETAVAGNLTDLNGKAVGPGPGAGTGDFDGDGRTDLAEYTIAPFTDPTKADTDGDTLSDGAEIAGAGTRPPTNPNLADTDGDHLSDAVEDNSGTFVSAVMTGTDPTKADTDADGWADDIELEFRTDPTKVDSFPNPPVEPIVFYDFEDASDGTIVKDGSKLGNDGEIVGDVTFTDAGAPDGSTPGRSGRFSFDGAGHIDVTGINIFEKIHNYHDGDYTLACWLKPDEISLSGDHFIFGQTDQGVHNGVRGSGTLHTAHWGADSNAATPLEADVWVHAVWTYDGAADLANIYLNGENDLENFSQRAPNGSGILIIGGRNGGTENFVGELDDVAVWNQILSMEKIQELAEGGSPIGAAPGAGFTISSVERILGVEGAADQLKITWNSRSGATYAVDTSPTIPDTADGWEEAADGVDSGGELTSFTVNLEAGATQLYVRVREE
jgi:hypothetical protein